MELSYRKATEDDLNKIIDLFKNAVTLLINNRIDQWDNIYPDKDTLQDDIDKKQLYIGLLGNDIAVAFVVNNITDNEYKNGKWEQPDDSYMVVHRLCVNAAYQHMNIAHDTMIYIEKQLSIKGIKSIRLDAFPQNPYAIRLYNKLGYKTVGKAMWRKGLFYLMEKMI